MRAAVVGGGAYAVGKRTAKKEEMAGAAIQDAQDKAAQAQQAAAQASAPSAGLSESDIAKLKQLAELRDSGALTEEEFEQAKKGILGV